jgi:surface antigen
LGQTTTARRVRALLLASAAALLVALQTAGAAPAGAVTDAPVVAGPGGAVDAHAGPSTTDPVVAWVPSGATVPIQCTVQQGEPVAGTLGSGEVWDRLADGSYVADAFVDTGSSHPVEPDCDDAGAYPYTDESWDAVDPWNFYFRECTSYAAHRLNQDGIGFSNAYGGVHWGNANHWDDAARTLATMPGYGHVTVDSTPSVGDVAQSDAGDFGHVAYVAAVNADGMVTVEEYNYDVDGTGSDHNFNQRTVPATSFRYIDVNG